jgi:predicted dehydrogenase
MPAPGANRVQNCEHHHGEGLSRTMGVAIVGCGFVADLYMTTLRLHPRLELVGVFDRDRGRAQRFAGHHRTRAYESLEQILCDSDVGIVVNLTNPGAHYEVSKAALEAGKYVYSEKPLAMELAQARDLVELAECRGLQISSAPATFLSESAQTMWKALRENRVGKVHLVYAEMDDGLVHRMPYRSWVSGAGAPWPYQDEFEVGCTLEHAGYCLSWLAGFFGPAKSVTAFASTQIPHKADDVPSQKAAPDFSVACITFRSGVVARLTCSIIAPHDHHLRVFGEDGVLWTDDTWQGRSPVYLRRFLRIRRRMMLHPLKSRIPLLGTHLPRPKYRGASHIDFARGIAELADAVGEGRPSRLSPRFSLHVNELALAIQNARCRPGHYECRTSFDPVNPMPWAK